MGETTIKDPTGKIIGTIKRKPDGSTEVRDFYGKVLGGYDARFNVTRDFYGRVVSEGDASSMLFNK